MMISCVKKKTVLLVAFLAILTLLPILLIEPVVADPKPDQIEPVVADPKPEKFKKVERTTFTTNFVFVAGNSGEGEQVLTETGILYVKNAISTGYINEGSPISGAVWTSLSGTMDLTTMLGSFNGKWILTTVEGTFEGSVVGIVTFASVSGRFVGHGTNDLRGQKIKGSFEGTVNNYIVDLTLQGEITSK